MGTTYREERIERKRRELRRKKNKRRLLIFGATALVIGGIAGGLLGSSGKASLKEEIKKLTQELTTKAEEVAALQEANVQINAVGNHGNQDQGQAELPWNLTLVNPWNEMEEGYKPELAEVEEDMYVDSRIADSVKQMLSDARAMGLSPFICSAYRSEERQEQLFNEHMKEELNTGLGYFDAYQKTATTVAVPGTSEHALGLAVDIVSVEYTNLDSGQEETDVFKWMKENCYKYGFILRYPNGTTDITGIIYEPWHYRYVGEEVAAEIQQLGVTYEEYLENHYQK